MIKFKIVQAEETLSDSFSLKIAPVEEETFRLSFFINKEDGEFINYLLQERENELDDDEDDEEKYKRFITNEFTNKLLLYKSILATCEAGGSFVSGVSVCNEMINNTDLMFGVLYVSSMDGGYLVNSIKVSFSIAMILSIIGGMHILMGEELLNKFIENSENTEGTKEEDPSKDKKTIKPSEKTVDSDIKDSDINNFVKKMFSGGKIDSNEENNTQEKPEQTEDKKKQKRKPRKK